MYQEDNDDTTRVGLWITFGVVALLIVSIISGVVVRQLRGVSAEVAVPPLAGVTTTVIEEIVLIEAPLAGDLLATLYFDSAQSALPSGAGAEIEKAVQALAAAPSRKIVVSGFHDASGDAAINAELAKQRALSVRAALLAAGVDGARIALRKPEVTQGSGTEQEARRVELRLID